MSKSIWEPNMQQIFNKNIDTTQIKLLLESADRDDVTQVGINAISEQLSNSYINSAVKTYPGESYHKPVYR